MASAIWMESGTDATQDISFWTGSAGSVSSATDQSQTGGRSIKLNTTSPAVTATAYKSGVFNDAGRRLSIYVRLNTVSGMAASRNLFNVQTSAGSGIIGLQVNPSGSYSLQLTNASSGTAQYTLTGTIVADTWYRFCISYTITSSTNYQVTVYRDGVQVGNVTYATGSFAIATGSDRLQLSASSVLGANVIRWYDDIYIDDGADYTDTGDIHVTAKRPNANSTNTFDTTTSTTNSGYGTGNSIYVNERPLATTGARRMNGTGGSKIENFAIENAATGDVDLTGKSLVARLSWMHASGISTDTIYDNASAATPGSGTVSGAGIYYTAATSTTYPSNPAAGMGRPTGNATDAILNECGVLIAYTAVTGYSLDAIAGSLAVTGSAAAVLASRLLDGLAGHYVVTGSAATTVASRNVAATAGAFSVTGASALTVAARLVAAAAGTVTITGTSAQTLATRRLNTDVGSYSVTGVDAGMWASRVLGATAGASAITGASVFLTRGVALNAATGSVTITGAPATPLALRVVIATSGAFLIAGSDAILTTEEPTATILPFQRFDCVYNKGVSLTPSDTVNVDGTTGTVTKPVPCDAVYVGGAGTVACVLENGNVAVLSVASGYILPVRFIRINSTGTTATQLVALYEV